MIDQKSSFSLWISQCFDQKANLLKIFILNFITIPSTLLLLSLIPYIFQVLHSEPHFLSWSKIFGGELGKIVAHLFRETSISSGLTIQFQEKWLCLSLALVGFVAFLSDYKSSSIVRMLGERLALKLRSAITQKYFSLQYQDVSKIHSGILSHSVGDDSYEINQTFTRICNTFFSDGVFCIVLVIWIIYINALLFILFSLVLIPTAIITSLVSKKMKKFAKQGLFLESEILKTLVEKLQGWQTIFSFRSIDFEIKNFRNSSHKLMKIWKRFSRMQNLISPVNEWMIIVAIAFIFILAFRQLTQQNISQEKITGFAISLVLLGDKTSRISRQISTFKRGTEALRRTQKFIYEFANPFKLKTKDRNKEIQKHGTLPSSTVEKKALENGLNFQDVTIKALGAVRDSSIISHFSKTFAPGKCLGIIGQSGVGKTTFLLSVIGLLPIENGKIFFNRREVSTYNNSDRRLDLFYISQKPYIITGSILDNILYPEIHNEVTPEMLTRAQRAKEKAYLDKDLSALTHGLSGGEKQRLIFARLFYHSASLIIIDEGTSALDAELETKVMKNLKEFSKNSVIFLVTHREQLLQFCDETMELKRNDKKLGAVYNSM